MGVVNVTPDSFSDGGRFFSVGAAVEHGLRVVFVVGRRAVEDLPQFLAAAVLHEQLIEEAVELRFGQWIGAFLLQRVLRGEHVERLRQIVTRAGNGDVLLLHRLQQRRLRARAGAVDLVGHQQLREHGA